MTAFRRRAIADSAPHGLPNYDDVCLIRPILDDRIYRCALKGGRLRFGTDIEEADDGNVVTEPQAIANYGMIGRGPGFPVRRTEERRVGKSVSVRVDFGGRRIIKKKNNNKSIL